jgi:hypothetical protein
MFLSLDLMGLLREDVVVRVLLSLTSRDFPATFTLNNVLANRLVARCQFDFLDQLNIPVLPRRAAPLGRIDLLECCRTSGVDRKISAIRRLDVKIWK